MLFSSSPSPHRIIPCFPNIQIAGQDWMKYAELNFKGLECYRRRAGSIGAFLCRDDYEYILGTQAFQGGPST